MKEQLSEHIRGLFRTPEAEKSNAIQIYVELLPNLRKEDVETILGIVRDNVEKTIAYGYTIPADVIQKEELFCLTFVNRHGGAEGIAQLGWDRALNLLHHESSTLFAQELEDAFHHFSADQGGGVRTWYAAHWTCLNSDIMRAFIH